MVYKPGMPLVDLDEVKNPGKSGEISKDAFYRAARRVHARMDRLRGVLKRRGLEVARCTGRELPLTE